MDITASPSVHIRYPNRDFFLPNIPGVAPVDDWAEGEHPFSALTTKPDTRIRDYARGDAFVRVIPSVMGMATVFDRDVLLYCISQLMARKDAGLSIGKVVQFNAYDLLVATNRQTSGRGYDLLEGALTRLRGTTFQTTVRTGSEQATRIFGMIESADILRKEPVTGRMVAVEVVLSDFLFRAIESNQVLPIHRDYFRLRSPVDRRLYELARKHCSELCEWAIGLDVLKEKVAFSSDERKLRFHLRKVTATQHLPDYTIAFDDDVVTFTRRPAAVKPPELTVDSLDRLLETGALEIACAEAQKRNLDFYALKSEFIALMETKGRPANVSGAFVGFVRKKKRAG